MVFVIVAAFIEYMDGAEIVCAAGSALEGVAQSVFH